jgi:hypothetical protein
MPKALLKSTYFITCTKETLHQLQQGKTVQIMAVRDELEDGSVEEIWVEIKPEIE